MKLELNNITSGYASTDAINTNNTLIENAIENTLSRDGSTPNTMESDLDMNGNRIINQLAQEGSGFIWKGTWTTTTVYDLNNLVFNSGNSYICLVTHTSSGNFATDLAAGKWTLFAEKGNPGAGSGDMLISNNLSELTATQTTARGNIGAAKSGANSDITSITGNAATATLADSATTATSATNITTPASDTVAGKVELATNAETITGTDATRATTPAGIAAVLAVAEKIAVLQYKVASGTGSGTTTGNAFSVIPLNTSVTDDIGLSLASNQFTLPAGKYHIRAWARYGGNGASTFFKLNIYNATAASHVIQGDSGVVSNWGTGTISSMCEGVITVAAGQALELYAWTGATAAVGAAVTSGQVEVYAEVVIRKI